MKLIINDDANKHHSYVVPCCVFNPKTPANILGVTSLVTLLGDNTDATDHLAEDVTTITSGDKKAHFIWDHVMHEQNL